MKEINATGMSCPGPLLLTKNVIDEDSPGKIKVSVDNEAAAENVGRFLSSNHYTVSRKEENDQFIVIGELSEPGIAQEKQTAELFSALPNEKKAAEKKIMVIISSTCMGHGDDELGTKLIHNFIRTLNEMGNELWRLVFINSGVKLTIEGAQTLSEIQNLEKSNIKILVCGTCLDHFNILKLKKVGETTNMLDIVTAMQLADKVITI
jgi:selenium metabolism protein YedF